MSDFIQIHALTSYPPANLNRDDSGQPKTAMMGGALRARVSSQSLKRAWRTSALFEKALKGHVGTRTKRVAERVRERLIAAGQDEKSAQTRAEEVVTLLSEPDSKNKLHTGQLVHLAPAEIAQIEALADRLASGEKMDLAKEMLLGGAEAAADIAMFGRMMASRHEHSVEAAVQVAHAITTHRVAIEDDYFTAVDDLKPDDSDDAGAAHVGEQEFVAGLFYLYLCIDRELLLKNLGGDAALARTALRALVEAALRVGPRGKQASFASRAYASYALAERGPQQPRSLSVAFLKPIGGADLLGSSISALSEVREQMDAAYGACADECYVVNVPARAGTLGGLFEFMAR